MDTRRISISNQSPERLDEAASSDENIPAPSRKEDRLVRIFTALQKIWNQSRQSFNYVSWQRLKGRPIELLKNSPFSKYVQNMKLAFSQQSETTKKSLLRHSIVVGGYSFSLLFHQLAEIGALRGASIGEIGLGIAGLCFEAFNIAQMVVRFISFLKLYSKARLYPGAISVEERAKLVEKTSKQHLIQMLAELGASLTGIASHALRIAAVFIPALSLGVIALSFLSSLSSTIEAISELMKTLKDPTVSKKSLLLKIGIVLLNALATTAFLSQAIMQVSPPPLSAVATLSFALLQFFYIAIALFGLKVKAEQRLNMAS
ncbi:hypothetical protein [Candidatus Similichlamydia laticola]|uniref:Uncharacterized protein n=1 Tax=Candidatus Similichlamydia laticola TaxID=2170265 RepID=A0A369KDF6_9BACT|nr:hypothetical protein [Candidatus Similichlamydia laticola]RDB31490.1 hypothetical protein HAT2_00364 [Candidatus Similichlamydia laticola]